MGWFPCGRYLCHELVELSPYSFFCVTVDLQSYPFKCQPYKMVKHTQTIFRLWQTNYLSVFKHFARLALKWLHLVLWSFSSYLKFILFCSALSHSQYCNDSNWTVRIWFLYLWFLWCYLLILQGIPKKKMVLYQTSGNWLVLVICW